MVKLYVSQTLRCRPCSSHGTGMINIIVFVPIPNLISYADLGKLLLSVVQDLPSSSHDSLSCKCNFPR